MSSGIEKFELRDNHTWEDASGEIFVSISTVPSEGPLKVTGGALGCDNVRKEMTVGDVIHLDAASRGKFEIRLRSVYQAGGQGSASFHIAKLS